MIRHTKKIIECNIAFTKTDDLGIKEDQDMWQMMLIDLSLSSGVKAYISEDEEFDGKGVIYFSTTETGFITDIPFEDLGVIWLEAKDDEKN